MALLGNIIWFVFGGWLISLYYLIGSIILFPLLPFLFPMVRYTAFPFGRAPVRRAAIVEWKKYKGMSENEDGEIEKRLTSGFLKFIANFVWIILFGWVLALMHLISGLMNLLLCFLIITTPICLPNVMAHFKLIPVAFRPFGIKIVPKSLADEINHNAHANNL